MTPSANVFDSAALPLLIQLEGQGFDLQVTNGALFIKPTERLTPALLAQLRQHKPELITLVRVCDAGVQERLVVDKQQLANAPEGTTPDFVFRRGTPYSTAVCFSCGANLPERRYGRCWRCSLAWRMAVGVPIPAEQATAYDGARVMA